MAYYKYFKFQNGDKDPVTHKIKAGIADGGNLVAPLRIARLRHRHGFSECRAALLASLIYGEKASE